MTESPRLFSRFVCLLGTLYWALPIHFWGRPNPKPNAGIWGDLDDVELIEAVEAFFEITLSDKDAEALETLGDMQDLLTSRKPDMPEDVIWHELCRITSAIGNGKADEYTRDTMFLCRI